MGGGGNREGEGGEITGREGGVEGAEGEGTRLQKRGDEWEGGGGN